jgi:hypothetical protein
MARFPKRSEPVEDSRPIGSLLFADPSKAAFPQQIHTYNEPFSPRASGHQHGIRTVTARETTYWDPKRTGHSDEDED